MYNSNWEVFLEKYNKGTPPLRALLDSEDIPILAASLIEKFQLEGKKRNVLISLISDILLETISLRSAEDIMRTDVVNDKSILSTLVTEVEKFIKEKKVEVADEQQSKNNPELIIKVPPLRTMEMDAKKIHGYGAFRGVEPREDQPVYRSEQAKLVPPPSYTDDSSPPNRT